MSSNDQHQFKDRYMLRLPDGMRDRIKAAAEVNNRSMNAEIVATLEKAYPEPHSKVVNLIKFLLTLPDDERDEFVKNTRLEMDRQDFPGVSSEEKDQIITDLNDVLRVLRSSPTPHTRP